MPEQFGPLTEREKNLIKRLFSQPDALPTEFKTWLKQQIEAADPEIEASQILSGTISAKGITLEDDSRVLWRSSDGLVIGDIVGETDGSYTRIRARVSPPVDPAGMGEAEEKEITLLNSDARSDLSEGLEGHTTNAPVFTAPYAADTVTRGLVCRRTVDGKVTLTGRAKTTGVWAINQTVFTLPVGFRPTSTSVFPVTALNSAPAWSEVAVGIFSTGVCWILAGLGGAGMNNVANEVFVFDGVSFWTD